jgi:hypothetical protein
MGPIRSDQRRFAMLEEMDRHRREVATLSHALARLSTPSGELAAGTNDPRALLLTADMTKHLISIALLSAQLSRRDS